MERTERTLVTIIAERILRERVLEGIRSVGARGYTLTEVIGEGTSHISAHEWEGPSIKVDTLVSDEVAEQIVDLIADRFFRHHSIIIYTSRVQVLRGDRF